MAFILQKFLSLLFFSTNFCFKNRIRFNKCNYWTAKRNNETIHRSKNEIIILFVVSSWSQLISFRYLLRMCAVCSELMPFLSTWLNLVRRVILNKNICDIASYIDIALVHGSNSFAEILRKPWNSVCHPLQQCSQHAPKPYAMCGLI